MHVCETLVACGDALVLHRGLIIVKLGAVVVLRLERLPMQQEDPGRA